MSQGIGGGISGQVRRPSLTDPRLCRPGIGIASSAAVGLLDPVGRKYIDATSVPPGTGQDAWRYRIDASCIGSTSAGGGMDFDGLRGRDQFYSGGTSENEYAYVWDRPPGDSDAMTSSAVVVTDSGVSGSALATASGERSVVDIVDSAPAAGSGSCATGLERSFSVQQRQQQLMMMAGSGVMARQVSSSSAVATPSEYETSSGTAQRPMAAIVYNGGFAGIGASGRRQHFDHAINKSS